MAEYTIGLLSHHLTGPFNSAVLSGIQRAVAEQHGHTLAIQLAAHEVAVSHLAEELVDGWIVLVHADGIDQLAKQGKPIVTISTPTSDHNGTAILPDNLHGAMALVTHLLEHGHTQIAFVGYMVNQDFQQRYQGYCDVLLAHGITPDPALLGECGGYRPEHGRAAIEQVLATQKPFTAVVAASDDYAIGVIAGLGAAGLRVPQDIALVGFDDIDAAQYTNPPLTTVRQRFDMLGEYAARALLQQIAGGSREQSPIYVPTSLVIRESCGCFGAQITSSQSQLVDNWMQELIIDLVRSAMQPLAYDTAVPPDHMWPGITWIVECLAANLAGEKQAATDLSLAWQSLHQLTSDLHTLYQIGSILEAAAHQQLSLQGQQLMPAQVAAFLVQCRLGMFRAYFAQSSVEVSRYRRLLEAENQVMADVLGTDQVDLNTMNWLRPTDITWAMLGLWVASPDNNHAMLQVRSTYSRETPGLVSGGQIQTTAFPPINDLPITQHGFEHCLRILPIRTPTRDWGLFAYIDSAVVTGYDSSVLVTALIGMTLDQEQLLNAVRQSQATLQLAYEQARALADTVHELGCPRIPLLPGVLLIPLIGAINGRRAQQIIERVLEGVSQEKAAWVLLDITGVPLVDTHVAAAFIQIARAVSLLGARVIIVGVRPEIAQSIVSLGVDLNQIETRPTLAAAVQALIKR